MNSINSEAKKLLFLYLRRRDPLLQPVSWWHYTDRVHNRRIELNFPRTGGSVAFVKHLTRWCNRWEWWSRISVHFIISNNSVNERSLGTTCSIVTSSAGKPTGSFRYRGLRWQSGFLLHCDFILRLWNVNFQFFYKCSLLAILWCRKNFDSLAGIPPPRNFSSSSHALSCLNLLFFFDDYCSAGWHSWWPIITGFLVCFVWFTKKRIEDIWVERQREPQSIVNLRRTGNIII